MCATVHGFGTSGASALFLRRCQALADSDTFLCLPGSQIRHPAQSFGANSNELWRAVDRSADANSRQGIAAITHRPMPDNRVHDPAGNEKLRTGSRTAPNSPVGKANATRNRGGKIPIER